MVITSPAGRSNAKQLHAGIVEKIPGLGTNVLCGPDEYRFSGTKAEEKIEEFSICFDVGFDF